MNTTTTNNIDTLFKNDPSLYPMLPTSMKTTSRTMLAVAQNGMMLEHAPVVLRSDVAVVDLAVSSNPRAFKFADVELKSDESRIVRVVSRGKNTINLVDDKHVSDLVLLSAVKRDPSVLRSGKYKTRMEDVELVRSLVNANGLCLEYVTEVEKDDELTVNMAINNNPSSVRFASDRLKSDTDIVSTVLGLDCNCFVHLKLDGY